MDRLGTRGSGAVLSLKLSLPTVDEDDAGSVRLFGVSLPLGSLQSENKLLLLLLILVSLLTKRVQSRTLKDEVRFFDGECVCVCFFPLNRNRSFYKPVDI